MRRLGGKSGKEGRRRKKRERTRTALRAQVAQDDDRLFALLDGPALDRVNEVLLVIEHARFSGELEALLAGDFSNSTARCEIALQDTEGASY